MLAPLEIHHINVSQGDSTLIIYRDTDKLKAMVEKKQGAPAEPLDYLPFAVKNNMDLGGTVKFAVLIDAGDDCYGEGVAGYMQKYGVRKMNSEEKLIIVVTHYHTDHISGLRSVFWEASEKSDVHLKYMPRYLPDVIYDHGSNDDLDPNTPTMKTYFDDIENLKLMNVECRKAEPNETLIELGKVNDIPIQMHCVASNGFIYNHLGKRDILDRTEPPDPNGLSVCFVLEFGDFRYFLGGDIGGNGEEKGGNEGSKKDKRSPEQKKFSSHPDIETSLREAFCSGKTLGHVCCLKASHHGSASSNDCHFLAFMQPKVAVVSAGIRLNFHYHPTQECFNRLDSTTLPSNEYSVTWPNPKGGNAVNNTVEGYYITEMSKDFKKKKTKFERNRPKGKVLGDIIVRPSQEDVIAVKEKKNNKIQIQVYGTGEFTSPDVRGDKVLADKEGFNKDPYPVGPWIHTCDKH